MDKQNIKNFFMHIMNKEEKNNNDNTINNNNNNSTNNNNYELQTLKTQINQLNQENEKLKKKIVNLQSEIENNKSSMMLYTHLESKTRNYEKTIKSLEETVESITQDLRMKDIEFEKEFSDQKFKYECTINGLRAQLSLLGHKYEQINLYEDYMRAMESDNRDLFQQIDNLGDKNKKDLQIEKTKYQIKLDDFKKKTLKMINQTKLGFSEKLLENVNKSSKIVLLQNATLYTELSEQSELIEELYKKLIEKDKVIKDLKVDLELHKSTQILISNQNKKICDILKSSNNKVEAFNKNNDAFNNNQKIIMKTEPDENENEIVKNKEIKNKLNNFTKFCKVKDIKFYPKSRKMTKIGELPKFINNNTNSNFYLNNNSNSRVQNLSTQRSVQMESITRSSFFNTNQLTGFSDKLTKENSVHYKDIVKAINTYFSNPKNCCLKFYFTENDIVKLLKQLFNKDNTLNIQNTSITHRSTKKNITNAEIYRKDLLEDYERILTTHERF